MAMNLSVVETCLKDLQAEYDRASGQLALLEQQKGEKEALLDRVQSDIEVWGQVQTLLTKAGDFAREQLKMMIEETVSSGLQAVFCTDDIRFKVDMRTLSGKPAARWMVVTQHGETVIESEPEDAKGGGVTDVVSLALRCALLELSRPKPGGPVVLDEPGKMISKDYIANVADFVKQYLQQTGRQGIMITHHAEMADVADVSYQVRQENGLSEVTKHV